MSVTRFIKEWSRAMLWRYQYPNHPPIPWKRGFISYRDQFVSKALRDESILEIFRHGGELPTKYGVSVCERCIEFPWLLADLPKAPLLILDAGSALNHSHVLKHPLMSNKTLHIQTLGPESEYHRTKSVSYLYGDLRNLVMRDETYDAVVCISTLEHIGFDNSRYTSDQTFIEHDVKGYAPAMKEFRRVLKAGGVLYLTVPFGQYEDLGLFQQFDSPLLSEAILAFGRASVTKAFYRYTPLGWQRSAEEDCRTSRYSAWIAESWRKHELRPTAPYSEPDRVAAARAVACVRLTKEPGTPSS